MKICLNQLQKNCNIYLGYVRITSGVAVKSKWMRKILKFSMKNAFFEKSFVHTLIVTSPTETESIVVMPRPVEAHTVGEKESVSRIFLII